MGTWLNIFLVLLFVGLAVSGLFVIWRKVKRELEG